MDLNFWLNFLYFLLAITLAWYIPGRVVLGQKFSNSKLATLCASFILGLVLWGWQGYIFGYLGVRFLTYPYLAIFFFLWFKQAKLFLGEWRFSLKDIDRVALFIIVLGIFSQNLMTWGSGLQYPEGIRFFRTNSLDGVMHLGYIQNIIEKIPPDEPGLSGEIIRNYHYWSDLVVAEVDRVFNTPIINSFFQYSNFFLSLFLGISSYSVMKLFSNSKVASRWFVFLLMLGGDFGYLLLFILGRGFLNFNVLTIDNGAYFLQNPPWAYSVIVLLGGLLLFSRWLEDRSIKWGILMAIVFSSLVGFKIYSGILVLTGIGFLTLYFLFGKKWSKVFVFPLMIALALIIYLPNNLNSGGLFFAPFEWPINFLTQGDIGLSEWELRRRTYLVESNWKRVIQMEVMMIVVFFFSHFGIKLLGFIPTRKIIALLGTKKLIFFYGGIMTVLFLGLFFLQKSGGFNVFNFFNAAGLFLSFFTALFLAFGQKRLKPFYRFVFIILIVILAVPRVINENKGMIMLYYEKNSPLVSNEELQALKVLKDKTPKDSLVLVYNKGTLDGMTPLVGFFSNRATFLSGQWLMSSHGIDFSKRAEIADKIFFTNSKIELLKRLRQNKINYIYLPQGKLLNIPQIEMPLSIIFQNNAATIIKIN